MAKNLQSGEVDVPASGNHVEITHANYPTLRRRTPWQKLRTVLREPMAELIGTATLVTFGTGVNCQVSLSSHTGVASSPRGDFLSVAFGWGIGLGLGAWVAGGISGGHLNPAVTLAMATWRGFSWKKVPAFILAQLIGGILGAAVIYGTYFEAINIVEGGQGVRTQATASLFATYALDYMNAASCFFAEFLGTTILAFMVVAASDKGNNAPPKGMFPLVLALVLLGLASSIGMQTSFAFNPARDFGPRLLLAMAGYGSQLFTFKSHYWIWCPIIAPIVGAQVGIAVYDLLLLNKEGSRFPEKQFNDRTLVSGTMSEDV